MALHRSVQTISPTGTPTSPAGRGEHPVGGHGAQTGSVPA